MVSRETSVQDSLDALNAASTNPAAGPSPELSAENPTMEAALTSHTDGRTWVAFFGRVTLEPRPNSGGKGPADAFSRELLALHQL